VKGESYNRQKMPHGCRGGVGRQIGITAFSKTVASGSGGQNRATWGDARQEDEDLREKNSPGKGGGKDRRSERAHAEPRGYAGQAGLAGG